MPRRSGDSVPLPTSSATVPLLLVLGALVIVTVVVTGCRTGDAATSWPARPDRVLPRGEDTYLGYDLDRDGRLDYLQRLRHGYKDQLYFPNEPGGPPRDVVARPAKMPPDHPVLLLLLDGVAYERIRGLYEEGRFRLFRPPARLISVFPTLTDPAYDVLFKTGPTPGYEAGFFDRAANRLNDGLAFYLQGGNERWVRYSDYRLSFVEDAIMYLYPRGVYSSELRRARRVVDQQLTGGRRHVVIYMLTTDGLGHMLRPTDLDRELSRLDDWLERLVYDYRGQIEVVMLADHGMSTLPPGADYVRRFDLRGVLRETGLHVTSHLKHPGDVAVPLFGLLDLGRVHAYDSESRDRALAALRSRPEIEVLALRDGDSIRVYAGDEAAQIRSRKEDSGPALYSYEPLFGDPFKLADACAALRAASRMDTDGFATARAWLEETGTHDFPAAPPRLWEGFFSISREHPDLVVSLKPQWFVGSGTFSRFVRMQGTHGGLHRRATETFAMTTTLDLTSPLELPDVFELLPRAFHWEPQTRR